MKLSRKILEVVKSVLPENRASYPLHEPEFIGNEAEYVAQCIKSGWVSSLGAYVDQFESDLSKFLDVKNIVVTVNGTSALHICYKVMGIKENDEVLVPALTFVATINAIQYCGAFPNFVDSSHDSMSVCPDKLAEYLEKIAEIKNGECFNKLTKRPIKALCVVHVLGHPAKIDSLKKICDQYNLKLIEDAAEGLGSYYKGSHVGSVADISALSFNGNKIITTGGGGAVFCNDDFIANQARHLATTAKVGHKWEFEHDQTAYNYRMPNLNAALGCAQLEGIERVLQRKRALSEKYQNGFKSLDELKFFSEPINAKSNFWLNSIVLNQSVADFRDAMLDELHDNNIFARPLWRLTSDLKMYRDAPRMDLSNATDLYSRVILLPSSPNLVQF